MKEKKKHKLTQENKQNNSLLFSSLHKTILKYEAVFLDFFFFLFLTPLQLSLTGYICECLVHRRCKAGSYRATNHWRVHHLS